MKHLNQFITEYIVKKKLDKFVDSEHNYEYFPKTKEELIENIRELVSKRKYNFNCIDTSEITDMKSLFANEKQLRDVNFNVSEWNVSNVRTMAFMFANCSALQESPALLSTRVTNNCYWSMFLNCTSLTTAPSLKPANTATGEFSNMFSIKSCPEPINIPEHIPKTAQIHQFYIITFAV